MTVGTLAVVVGSLVKCNKQHGGLFLLIGLQRLYVCVCNRGGSGPCYFAYKETLVHKNLFISLTRGRRGVQTCGVTGITVKFCAE